MTSKGASSEGTPTIRDQFWTAADTCLVMNCHTCASKEVELIHVHYHRIEMIRHECPMCGSRVGPDGPNPNCEICKTEFTEEELRITMKSEDI